MGVKTTTATVWVGIDVSKETLDVCLLRASGKEKHKQFSNDASGHAKLLRWVQHLAAEEACHYCLESTGSYSTAVAHFLAEAEHSVSIVNPARIKYAGLAQGVGNKTDKADARLIADYCRKEQPALWRAAAPEVRVLVALVRRLHSVQELVVQEQNRLAAPGLPPPVCTSLKKMIRVLEAEVKRLQQQIKEHPPKGHPIIIPDSRQTRHCCSRYPASARPPRTSCWARCPGALWADDAVCFSPSDGRLCGLVPTRAQQWFQRAQKKSLEQDRQQPSEEGALLSSRQCHALQPFSAGAL